MAARACGRSAGRRAAAARAMTRGARPRAHHDTQAALLLPDHTLRSTPQHAANACAPCTILVTYAQFL
ncbi:unnamed protein product [Arctia plantaginis]|uniref:Uncharacterized protein n=1 Tax=Arctia plantaginis TaxID=874455 RepID=A0A8S1A1S5_ARCPL|nr:unnamed protein product [Arctia plantaginis]